MAAEGTLMRQLSDLRLWRERSPRERIILAIGAGMLLLAAVFLLLIEPALEGRSRWQRELPQVRAEHATMQALAKQFSVAPTTAATPASVSIDRAALERSLNDAGIKPASLELSNGQLQARWNDVSFSALMRWLQHMQAEQGWSVQAASISARERIDRVDATVALHSLRFAP
jgi:general secretion pathway protein M